MMLEQHLVHRAVEAAARESYGRLVAMLAARTRDLAAAEDALADALLNALTSWPATGVPRNPQAWLMTAARHRLLDQLRHREVQARSTPTLSLLMDEAATMDETEALPDERLKLLFVCAHPAIDADMHTPLMLQTVLGLDAVAIGRAFLVAPKTMGQRLVRAKAKIRRAGIAFEIPSLQELPSRLGAILQAIYAAYSSGWDDVGSSRAVGLSEQALYLARVLRELLPAQPEVRGLLALLLHCEARAAARRVSGRFVPLSEQDPQAWNTELIEAAEQELAATVAQACAGRFQLEAAIQSVHAERRHTGRTHWLAICAFYDQLVQLAPSLGAQVARAAAHAEVGGAELALALLDELDAARVAGYQPYWAVRAHLLARLHRPQARAAFERAIGLTEDPAVREFLLTRCAASTANCS